VARREHSFLLQAVHGAHHRRVGQRSGRHVVLLYAVRGL
jgi:hypothetical protein